MDSLDRTPNEALPFRRPADYYSSPVEDVKPIFPRWVPFGCGSVSIVLLIVLVIGAAMASSGAFGEMFDLVFASMQGEVDKMMGRDVKAADKATFDSEMKTMRDAIRTKRLSVDRVQPLLRSIREVSADERVTAEEVKRLTRELREINRGAKKGS